ncbi:hypothetical protein E5198_08980 [Pseudomonas sp. A-1]|uniref:hypothetical protein n=1 Tax=Pseudomonas sp. A-1 TaxID=1821274 RepID=UPI0010A62919|nr:hypothetical protein [Pseudomonas sp. A-1]THG82611.1 hypothetical protein E5198_08980 [Pseudomonas sp. A-1]
MSDKTEGGLQALADRSAPFAFNLRRLRGEMPIWADAQRHPQIRREAYIWLIGYLAALADHQFLPEGECRRLEIELLRLLGKPESDLQPIAQDLRTIAGWLEQGEVGTALDALKATLWALEFDPDHPLDLGRPDGRP